jgi:serine/threonine protein kinase
VLKVPIPHDPLKVHIFSLREILSSQPMPSLSLRISLCFQLAECLSNFHAVDWLHKGLRSQNTLFFGPDVGSVDLQKPYLTGLELSRPDARPELTDVAKPNPEADLYRHPLVQGGENADAYRKSFDLYSLGIILLEVGCWSPIEAIVGYNAVSSLTGDELRSIKDKVLVDKNQAPLDSELPTKSRCLEVVSAHAGDTFRDIVEILLCANEIESPAYPGEKAALRYRRLREAFAEGVVERLQKMREAL